MQSATHLLQYSCLQNLKKVKRIPISSLLTSTKAQSSELLEKGKGYQPLFVEVDHR